jgi:hypothetical protein
MLFGRRSLRPDTVPPSQRDACYSYFKKAIPAEAVVATEPASVDAHYDSGAVLYGTLGSRRRHEHAPRPARVFQTRHKGDDRVR